MFYDFSEINSRIPRNMITARCLIFRVRCKGCPACGHTVPTKYARPDGSNSVSVRDMSMKAIG